MSVLSSQLPGSVGHQTYLLLRFHCDGDGLLPTAKVSSIKPSFLAVVFYPSNRKVAIAEALPPFSSVLYGPQSGSLSTKTVETGVSTRQTE